MPFRNPTNAVGGSFITSLQDARPNALPESHQRSWWIVHNQPTRRAAERPFRNPTNAVGGSFIPAYKTRRRTPLPKSHQRSWWIVHTSLQDAPPNAPSEIPPTQLVDRSYQPTRRAAECPSGIHQRSWWIVHNQPTRRAAERPFRNPTNAVGGSFITSL